MESYIEFIYLFENSVLYATEIYLVKGKRHISRVVNFREIFEKVRILNDRGILGFYRCKEILFLF